MSCLILNDKFEQRKNFKDSIIAYNGFIKDNNNEVIDIYWQKFERERKKIKDIVSKLEVIKK